MTQARLSSNLKHARTMHIDIDTTSASEAANKQIEEIDFKL